MFGGQVSILAGIDATMKLVSGRLAQLGEHHVRNVGVVGSNPMPSTKTPLS